VVLLLAAGLAGCGEDEPPVVQNFAPLHYEYLPKLQLNVGSIDVQDRSQPAGPEDVAASSPAVPAQVLARMAHDRLFAAGTSGVGTFVIDQASILRQPNGTLDGTLAAHLDITSGAGAKVGFAEMRVARQYAPGSDPQDERAELYSLTRQMMDDMNVEVEYQLRRTLKPWLVTGGAVPAPVSAVPLAPPGAATPGVAAPALPPATPPTEPPTGAPQLSPQSAEPPPASSDGYQDPALPPPPQPMSPPPGYLTLPPGAIPAMPPAT
jgi:hypothetical protein